MPPQLCSVSKELICHHAAPKVQSVFCQLTPSLETTDFHPLVDRFIDILWCQHFWKECQQYDGFSHSLTDLISVTTDNASNSLTSLAAGMGNK